MPLVVVPLGRDETGLLTLNEWDTLKSCRRVLFEQADHPLAARLRAEGIDARPLDVEPSADLEDCALVVDPTSTRTSDLARAGARVSAGPAVTPDDLTSAHAAYVVRRAASSLASLVAIMARLRSSDGCPWDREQSHRSLEVHLIEEAHEVIEAIDQGLVGTDLEEELGDVLLQVAFHSQMAADDARFDIAGVADAIVAKLVHRHPHVFGDKVVSGASEVVKNWEEIKKQEKGRDDPFEGIPASLPALMSAYKAQKRAAGLGFDAPAELARARLNESLEKDMSEQEALGEALFWLVAVARAAGIDPEGALRAATRRFQSSMSDRR
ncbi:MAG: nucleoside triphosphate pyrophosphohydrolase [Actinomycetota bacterium]|nr:nucleoside triphosphate pyrophosphohydrolase [Actinomycetota bacterium]